MEELRNALLNVDASSPSVQRAASAMMRHYDQSMIAVNEWRNALQMARGEQLLALLYVANEVLQNSKRNRGPNFLENMSPVLSQALQHICQRDLTLTEKVRRVVKIWADRQILSIRFVNELLASLETYRLQLKAHQSGHEPVPPPQQQRPAKSQRAPASKGFVTPTPETSSQQEKTSKNLKDADSDDEILNILEDRDEGSDSSDDDEDGDIFAANPESQKLQLDLNLETLATSTSVGVDQAAAAPKRRRRSMGSGTGASVQSVDNKRRASQRRRSNLVSDSVSTWNRLLQLQQAFYHAQLVLEKIDTALLKTPELEMESLVGDELQQAFRENTRFQQQVVEQRRLLHEIAIERHAIEQDCRRYLPWLEQAVTQDEGDLSFCDKLLDRISSFRKIHPSIRLAKQHRLESQRLQRLQNEKLEAERNRQEEEQKFREAALAKETEAKPGMVWNPSTREYQALNTDESWRD